MDIELALREEHSKENTMKIVDYISDDKQRFSVLMNLFFGEESMIIQRASWVMNYCAENKPTLVAPYIERMAQLLDEQVHDGVKRNIVRIFQFIDLPEEHHGLILNNCFQLLSDRKCAIAIRAFSMTVIDNLSKIYPEIQIELEAILEEEIKYGSSGFKNRAKKILKKMRIG